MFRNILGLSIFAVSLLYSSSGFVRSAEYNVSDLLLIEPKAGGNTLEFIPYLKIDFDRGAFLKKNETALYDNFYSNNSFKAGFDIKLDRKTSFSFDFEKSWRADNYRNGVRYHSDDEALYFGIGFNIKM